MRKESALSEQLKQLNPLLTISNGIYQNTSTQVPDSKLSNYIHRAVDHVFNEIDDLSLFSIKLEEQLLTNELDHALSPAPYNFLLSFDLDSIGCTLDLTQDFGGVTHYLASQVSHVDSVKIDVGKAKLCLKRCKEFQNVTHISESISDLSLANRSYDLIIVGDLEALDLDKPAYKTLINKLQLSLSNTGRLVINSKNQTRLNRWTSSGDDQLSFSHLYENQAKLLLNKSELDQILKSAGFLHWSSYASFSQGRSISNLFSENYLKNEPNSINHFNRLGSLGHSEINEYLAIKNLNQERGEIFDLASRFITIASASPTRSEKLCNINFAHFAGTNRKPKWRNTTLSVRESGVVRKIPLYKNLQGLDQENSSLTQHIDIQEFKSGMLLLDQWLEALTSNDSLDNLIEQYAYWLNELNQKGEFNKQSYDILPFNVIVSETSDSDVEFSIIDPEWYVDEDFGPDFILFRALFWFAFENRTLLIPLAKEMGLPTIGLFVLHYLKLNQQSGSNTGSANSENNNKFKNIESLYDFVELEESIQRQISANFRNKSVEYALLQTFDGEPLIERVQPACQISWGNQSNVFDEKNSVFLNWHASTEEQTLNTHPPAYTDINDVLRIDPIATMGMFNFSFISLSDANGNVLWQLESTSEISKKAKCINAIYSSSSDHFIALNEDPHLLFDLSSIKKRDQIANITIRFALIHNHYYDASITALTNAVNEQNSALVSQISSIESKRAEIEHLSAKLKNIDEHRQSIRRNAFAVKEANEQHIKNLDAALQQQTLQIQVLKSDKLVRNYFRIKNLIKRIVKKMIGRS